MEKIKIENIQLASDLNMTFDLNLSADVCDVLEVNKYVEVYAHFDFYGKDGNTKDTKLTSIDLEVLQDYEYFVRNQRKVFPVNAQIKGRLERKGDLHLLNEDRNGIDEVYAIFFLYTNLEIAPENQRSVVQHVPLLLSDVYMSDLVKRDFGNA